MWLIDSRQKKKIKTPPEIPFSLRWVKPRLQKLSRGFTYDKMKGIYYGQNFIVKTCGVSWLRYTHTAYPYFYVCV